MKTKTITKGKKPFNGRVYREQDGIYLSVTSIIHPDGIDYPKELLDQYASRGTIIHAQTEHFLTHYQWLSPERVATQKDIDNVLNGSLKLSLEACNPRGFLQEYGDLFRFHHLEQKVKHKTHRYAGRLDALGTYTERLAVIDFKTASNYTPEKTKEYFMQLSAYAHCISPRPEVLVIIPLNPSSPNGYDEPIVTTEIDHYFSLFQTQLDYVRNNYIFPV